MRILFCYPWLSLGGAPNTAITLARGLKERGHDIFFFTKTGGMNEEQLRHAGIPVITAPYDALLPHLYHLNPRAYRIFKATLESHRINIVHTFHLNSYFLALFAAPRMNIPVFFTAVWLLKISAPFPTYPGRVFFVAEEFKDYAAHLFGERTRELIVLPNRLDLSKFRSDVEFDEFASRMNLPESGWKIAFMSRIDTIKMQSLRHAVRAAELLARSGKLVTLAIAGDGPLFTELESLTAEVNRTTGESVVRLLGTVHETPEFLSWSDIVLGMGRSALEGMACGKPTLVVGENGLAGVVEPERVSELQYYNFAGRNLTRPVAPELLADEITRIMSDRERYDTLAAFARKHVLEHYDYQRGAERLEKFYEEALRDPPLTRGDLARLFWTNTIHGYRMRWCVALRLRVRGVLGRGRKEDVVPA